MFDIGWDEMALIAVVSLIVIGPKDLPVVLRQLGRWTRRARDMAAEFQRGLDDIAHESELDDLKRKMAEATRPGGIAQQIERSIDPDGALGRAMTLPPLDEGTAPTVAEIPPPALPPETPPARPPAP
jgi:sec-independent protein translocase protein TatB